MNGLSVYGPVDIVKMFSLNFQQRTRRCDLANAGTSVCNLMHAGRDYGK